MTNYYQTGRYPFSAIDGFVRAARDINHDPLTLTTYETEDILHDIPGLAYIHNGQLWWRKVDAYYHFTDDEKETPALVFCVLEHHPLEDRSIYTGPLYRLMYIDPSLMALWKHEMDRECEEEGEE